MTDHQPLTWLFSVKDPGSRLIRWRLELEQYDYKIVYKPGKKNQNADALSRTGINVIDDDIMSHFKDQLKNGSIDPIEITESIKPIFHKDHEHMVLFLPCEITSQNEVYDKLITYYSNEITSLKPEINQVIVFKDPYTKDKTYYLCFNRDKNVDEETMLNFYKTLINLKCALIDEGFSNNEIQLLLPVIATNEREYDIEMAKQVLSYIFHDRIEFQLCELTNKIVTPPEDQRQKIISYYHDSRFTAHKGIDETIRRIKLKYIWKNLTKDVRDYIKTCSICQQHKIDRHSWTQPFVITSSATKPLERINIDIVEIGETSNKVFVLTMIDELTKYLAAYILKTKSTSEVTLVLLRYCQHFGIPLRVHSDLGAEFVSKAMKKVCEILEINKTEALTQFPQSNGSVERVHATIKDTIRCLKTDSNISWELSLSIAVMTYNNSKHSSTGFTPSELMFGETRDHLRTVNTDRTTNFYYKTLSSKLNKLHKMAIETNLRSKERSLARVNSKRKGHSYKPGEYVLYKDKKKVGSRIRWTGPFKIIRTTARTITIQTERNKTLTVSIDSVKPYFRRLVSDAQPSSSVQAS